MAPIEEVERSIEVHLVIEHLAEAQEVINLLEEQLPGAATIEGLPVVLEAQEVIEAVALAEVLEATGAAVQVEVPEVLAATEVPVVPVDHQEEPQDHHRLVEVAEDIKSCKNSL